MLKKKKKISKLRSEAAKKSWDGQNSSSSSDGFDFDEEGNIIDEDLVMEGGHEDNHMKMFSGWPLRDKA